MLLVFSRYSKTASFCLRQSISPLVLNKRSLTTVTTATMAQYWNREDSIPGNFAKDKPVCREAKIISLSNPDDPANNLLYKGDLPEGSSLLAIGTNVDEFDMTKLKEEKPNVLFVSHPMARKPLVELLESLPSIKWVHARSAGIDFITSDALTELSKNVIITNSKGTFSSTLAEYTMMACAYFAKDLPRLLKNQKAKNWEKYSVQELRGATLGIIGYGDIGRATAKLASAYGMKVVALRRNPETSSKDPFCDVVYGSDKDSMNKLFSESDYVLCSLPLTPQTKGMITMEQFEKAKKDACFINVGRGPIVDEDAMIEALKTGKLKGAGLDVVSTEPLPKSSELWQLDNVLLSP